MSYLKLFGHREGDRKEGGWVGSEFRSPNGGGGPQKSIRNCLDNKKKPQPKDSDHQIEDVITEKQSQSHSVDHRLSHKHSFLEEEARKWAEIQALAIVEQWWIH